MTSLGACASLQHLVPWQGSIWQSGAYEHRTRCLSPKAVAEDTQQAGAPQGTPTMTGGEGQPLCSAPFSYLEEVLRGLDFFLSKILSGRGRATTARATTARATGSCP